MEGTPQVSGLLVEEAAARERSRAQAVAASVRLGAAMTFLALATALHGMGRPEWRVYLPMLSVYVLLAMGFFILRHRPVSPRIAWLAGLIDVGAVYVMQREALPMSDQPQTLATLTVSIFAVLVALSALTLRTLAVVGATAAALLAELLLMVQARLPLTNVITAAVILLVMAVVSQAAIRRLRFLVTDLSQTEVKRHLEQRRRTETDAARQTIQRMLDDAQAQNEQLERLQREKESLVQLIVHDLRSPLNAMMLSLEYVNQEIKQRAAGSDLSEALDDARSTASRVAAMVAQILDTAKLEEGRLALERSPIGAGELLRRVKQQFGPMARDKKVEVKVEVHGEVDGELRLRGDPRLFGRVIENLLSNSIRHTPPRGKILMAAVRESAGCRLSVHNNGASIEVADRERIFAKFQQAGAEGARLGGWGLGLYFCRMVVEAHGGHITVEDVEGWPTSFVLRVPAEPAADVQATAQVS
jgi:signal transduction histidine kinase